MALLISTDGFSISVLEYDTVDEARAKMSEEFHLLYDGLDGDTSEKEMSGLGKDSAIVYNNGEGVYVWNVYVPEIQKPKHAYYIKGYEWERCCPNCHINIASFYPLNNCPECGQAIDTSIVDIESFD